MRTKPVSYSKNLQDTKKKLIEDENLRMMGRLVNVKPTDSIHKLNKDYKVHRHRVKVIQKIQRVVTNEKQTIHDIPFVNKTKQYNPD